MTLRFKDLTLTNFGPYLGRQTIALETPEKSPVTVVHGENTVGKTQLFAALRWCLYETFTPQQSREEARRELPERLNRPARDDGEKSLEVVITFEANGDSYRLARRADIKGKVAEVDADLRIGATVIPTASIDQEIGRLLHPQISEFFLFDAELLDRFYERLATERERAFIRSSIEAVLGIPALQLAQHDIQELANEALQRQAKLAKSVGDAEKFRKRLRELASETESVERDKAQLRAQRESAESEVHDLRERMKTIEGLQADAREQELLEASLADGRRREEQLRLQLRGLLGSGWMALAGRPLQEALQRVQETNNQVVEHERAIEAVRTRVAVLEDRARGGVCPACDQPLPPPGPETERELAEARQSLQELLDATGGGRVDLGQERRIQALLDTRTIKEYAHLQRDLSELQLLQYERRQTLEGINDRLQGHKAADIRALGHRLKSLEDALLANEKAVKENERRAQVVTSEQQKLAKQLEKLPGANPEVVLEAGFFRYADDLLQSTIEAYRERVRAQVETDAQEMFLQLVHDPGGYGGLTISQDYKIELLDTRKEPRPTSEGGKQLLALSLIGALKHAAVRGGPVVLDSPLGRLDLEHRANVLQTWIPSLGAQAILLVQSGELTPEDAQRLLGGLIGQAYELVRQDGDPERAVIVRRGRND